MRLLACVPDSIQLHNNTSLQVHSARVLASCCHRAHKLICTSQRQPHSQPQPQPQGGGGQHFLQSPVSPLSRTCPSPSTSAEAMSAGAALEIAQQAPTHDGAVGQWPKRERIQRVCTSLLHPSLHPSLHSYRSSPWDTLPLLSVSKAWKAIRRSSSLVSL